MFKFPLYIIDSKTVFSVVPFGCDWGDYWCFHVWGETFWFTVSCCDTTAPNMVIKKTFKNIAL